MKSFAFLRYTEFVQLFIKDLGGDLVYFKMLQRMTAQTTKIETSDIIDDIMDCIIQMSNISNYMNAT